MPLFIQRSETLNSPNHRASVPHPKGKWLPAIWGLVAGVCLVCVFWLFEHRDIDVSGGNSVGPYRANASNSFPMWRHPGLASQEAPAAAESLGDHTSAHPDTPAPGNGLFRLDRSGQLALDERTRLGIEAILALTAPEQMQFAIETHLHGLPPKASAEAREFISRYEAYSDAQKRSYPPGRAPLIPEEGLAELAGLQALRASYFGHEAAQLMFGEEHAIAKRLLELMREDPLPDSPMETKAVRAQARFDAERGQEPLAPAPVQ